MWTLVAGEVTEARTREWRERDLPRVRESGAAKNLPDRLCNAADSRRTDGRKEGRKERRSQHCGIRIFRHSSPDSSGRIITTLLSSFRTLLGVLQVLGLQMKHLHIRLRWGQRCFSDPVSSCGREARRSVF